MKKSRKISLALGGAAVALVGGVWGYTTLNGATPLDASKMATVERGTMTRSVVATGKIEPITKVEIKSKANGIIERINTDVDRIVEVGSVLVELDKENLRAREREARANLQAARAALEGAMAQFEKNKVEAEAPELDSARRNYDRAHQLHEQKLVSPQALDDARSAVDVAQNRKASAQVQLGVSKAKIAEAQANVAQAQAAVERAEEELANSTIKAPIKGTVLTRDVEIGSPVSSILNLGSAATLVITHSAAAPGVHLRRPTYDDVVTEIKAFLADRVELAVARGVPEERIVIDPGHDLNKNTRHSLDITRRFAELADLGLPVLAAVSNKDFVGEAVGLDRGERLEASLAAATICALNGARILRMHKVRESVRAAQMVEAVLGLREPAYLRHNLT